MVFLELIGLGIIILLIILIIKLNKKDEMKKVEDPLANQLLLKQLEKIEKTMDEKAKEDNERQQKITKCVEDNIGLFTRTIHGTKSRGKVGEAILKQILAEPISSGLVVTGLQTDNGNVEFAWDLKNGKYLPIDAKMPELENIYKSYHQSEKPEEQLKLKKEILKIVENRKKEIKKYLNNQNTIDKGVLAIPDTIFDQFPDINKDAVKTGVFISGYTKVFLFACVLGESYTKGINLGSIGVYKQAVQSLKNILEEINKRTDTINRGVTQITNANVEIKTEVSKSLAQISQVHVSEKEKLE